MISNKPCKTCMAKKFGRSEIGILCMIGNIVIKIMDDGKLEINVDDIE